MGMAQDQARKEAATVFALWAKDNPRPFPVEPARMAQRLGIDVFVTSLPPNVSGALRSRPGYDPKIYIDSSDHVNRQRFTCAHELGHYVRAVSRGEENFDRVDYRNDTSTRGTDVEEVFANTFAACFLMPAKQVKEVWDRTLSSAAVAEYFGVSLSAAQIRLSTLKLA